MVLQGQARHQQVKSQALEFILVLALESALKVDSFVVNDDCQS